MVLTLHSSCLHTKPHYNLCQSNTITLHWITTTLNKECQCTDWLCQILSFVVRMNVCSLSDFQKCVIINKHFSSCFKKAVLRQGLISISYQCNTNSALAPAHYVSYEHPTTAMYHFCYVSLQDSPRLVTYCMLPYFMPFFDIRNSEVSYMWLLLFVLMFS